MVKPLSACAGGVIRRVSTKNPALKRLVEMGATPGARVDVIRRAPLGDPIQIALRGCAITLRKQDAAEIFVEERV